MKSARCRESVRQGTLTLSESNFKKQQPLNLSTKQDLEVLLEHTISAIAETPDLNQTYRETDR